jgi:hypothetical protein
VPQDEETVNNQKKVYWPVMSKSLFSIWLEKPKLRLTLLLWLVILMLLTAMAALPLNVTGPFNARTYEQAGDVRLDYSPTGAFLEPVTALAHIVTEAPDVRAAGLSVIAWTIGLAVCISTVRRLNKNRWRISRQTITAALGTAGIALFFLVVYGMFTVLVHIPNWIATAQDPELVLAELQTHTFGSYDGLISARDCLQWHQQRGCSVVAVTEHRFAEGGLEAAALAESDESLPAVLSGVEVDLDELSYVVAISTPEQFRQHTFDSKRKPLIPWIHQTFEGVVLALEDHLQVGWVENAADAGMDGFGVASDGHPDVLPSLQREVFATADKYHLPLVAWTDWHGIGSILRTWTAIRIPNAAALSRQQRAIAVLDALRRHDCSNITPLVVGRIGQVSLARAIFAPFVESIRYALSLSPLRVLGWWFWSAALFLIVTILLHLGIRPHQLIIAAAMLFMGAAIITEGFRLLIAHFSGQAPNFVTLRVGLAALAIGAVALLSGAIGAWVAVVRRQVKKL